MKELCKALNIKESPLYEMVFAAAMAEYELKDTYIVADERIYEVIQNYGIFEKWKDELLKAAKGIRNNKNLLRFVYLLKHVLAEEGIFDELIKIELPENEEALCYDFASFFAIVPLLEDMKKRYDKRKLPNEQFMESLVEFEDKANDYYRTNKRPGLKRHVIWLYKFIHLKILRVGRLNFEIFKDYDAYVTVFENKKGEHQILLSGECFNTEIKETDSCYIGVRSNPYDTTKREEVVLPKSDWKVFLKRGDPIVSVHIPAGGKLLTNLCEQAYKRMLDILNTYFSDYKYKLFACEYSWLMDPKLAEHLNENSNILNFQKKYTLYQNNSSQDAVYDFLFFEPHSTPIEKLPEDTSLRRNIKQLYINGGHIYEQGGLIFETKRKV